MERMIEYRSKCLRRRESAGGLRGVNLGRAAPIRWCASTCPWSRRLPCVSLRRLPAEIELDDLCRSDSWRCCAARDSYDAAQGASFATYAGIRIKGAMLDEVRAHDWLPRSVQEQTHARSPKPSSASMHDWAGPHRTRRSPRSWTCRRMSTRRLAGELACARMTHIEDSAEAGQAHAAGDATPSPELVGERGFRESLALRRWIACRRMSADDVAVLHEG
jgi:hypothetical protein